MNLLLNGVGRIGKAILRIINQLDNINIVAINELNDDIDNIIYSINYDSTYGKFDNPYQRIKKRYIKNSSNKIKILNKNCLSKINYNKYKIDAIIDASGAKIDINILKSLNVNKIFLTHPNKEADINLILGVNDNLYDPKKHKIISTSSCNATALMPILKLIDSNYGIKYGDIATIHPLLNHQKVLDSGCVSSHNRKVKCNFEFGRGSMSNIIPSQTTTIEACSYVNSNINSKKISSSSLRIPTDTVGAINVTLVLKNKIKQKDFIKLCKKEQKEQKYDVILNNFDPLVSSDFKAQRFTTIIDHRFTKAVNNKMIKLLLWYDNEWGYASKVVDIISKLGKADKNIT
jgi:glyceraldehyde 3-phosphate dehydrogenase